jgi:hypothetical protein
MSYALERTTSILHIPLNIVQQEKLCPYSLVLLYERFRRLSPQ